MHVMLIERDVANIIMLIMLLFHITHFVIVVLARATATGALPAIGQILVDNAFGIGRIVGAIQLG